MALIQVCDYLMFGFACPQPASLPGLGNSWRCVAIRGPCRVDYYAPSDWQMTDILYLLAKMNVQQVVEKLGKHYNYEIL